MNRKDKYRNIEDSYRILTLFEKEDISTQREAAGHLGFSLGKANYLINALIAKGFVKFENFCKSENKMNYRYILTPSGIEAKYRITVEFLKRKEEEYDRLQKEIDLLKTDLLFKKRN